MRFILDLFKSLGDMARRAFGYAQDSGLSDELVELTLGLARQAATELTTNAEKRKWVIMSLMALGINESLARLLVEVAVQLLKKETAPPQGPVVSS